MQLDAYCTSSASPPTEYESLTLAELLDAWVRETHIDPTTTPPSMFEFIRRSYDEPILVVFPTLDYRAMGFDRGSIEIGCIVGDEFIAASVMLPHGTIVEPPAPAFVTPACERIQVWWMPKAKC